LATEGASGNPFSWSTTVTPTLLLPPSKRILCIRLLNWPIDRLCRRRRELRENPLALVATVGNRRFISAACRKARALSVRPGIDQAEAMAICPSLVCLPHDQAADARGLRSMGRWMMRFTPIVCVANGPDDPLRMPDAVILDLTGCERVFHGLDKLLHKIKASIEQFQLETRIALGPNPGAAWAMTFSLSPVRGGEGRGEGEASRVARVFISPSPQPSPLRTGEKESFADIPCEALRLDTDTVAKLYHLGIQTIGQLMRFPREQLPSRFGPLLTLRLDQLLGQAFEPIVPLDLPTIISARMDFDGVVTSLEAIWVVFRDLLGRVISQLTRHGRGVRELDVQFIRAYATPIHRTIKLSRPSRDPVNLFNLFRCSTEQMEGSRKNEFLGMRLFVRVHEPLPDEQVNLLDGESYAGQLELDRLIERLCTRLGENAIEQVGAVESYIPERAYRSKPARIHRRGRLSDYATHDASETCRSNNPRPLCLLPRPIEVPVMVNPYNDTFGQPMQFVAQGGHVHRLPHVIGPERIAGQWWDGHNKTRDYFDVEDEAGQRFWLFRVNETRRWYLHGQYA
jgi:protein ImuB